MVTTKHARPRGIVVAAVIVAGAVLGAGTAYLVDRATHDEADRFPLGPADADVVATTPTPRPEPTDVADLAAGDVLSSDPGATPDGLGVWPVADDQWVVFDLDADLPDAVATTLLDLQDAGDPVDQATLLEQVSADARRYTGQEFVFVLPCPGDGDEKWCAQYRNDDGGTTTARTTVDEAEKVAQQWADEQGAGTRVIVVADGQVRG